IGPDPRNFNQRVSLGRNDLLIRTFLSQSLEKAISAGELSPPDQILVQGMWHNLYQQAKNQA
ncbi:YfcL family protein, partial [Klebsiella pneumoniae]|uniref:YfcL family protein n=1 Tax=Klebsiella pneumoniae TaxID=573 RepID=UPI001F62464E